MAPTFPGFEDFRANVTYTPRQFFTLVLPNSRRGTVRVVGYMLRRILGWVDRDGNPTRTQLRFTYSELVEYSGISRSAIAEALEKAVTMRFLNCVQPARPDSAGLSGQRGVYELRWDKEGEFTSNLEEFRGFYYREAFSSEERNGKRVVLRPTAARKNIPNAFFDHLIRHEPLSVIRVVGALMYYSIEWGPAGERKVPVQKSITEIAKLTRQSRKQTHQALREAVRKGYLIEVRAGRFDPAAGQESRAATYGIRWMKSRPANAPPVEFPGRGNEDDRPKKVHGEPVGKSIRKRCKKVHGERCKMVNGINTKTGNSKTGTTAASSDSGQPREETAAAVAVSSYDLLRRAGFDESAARELSNRHPAAIIERQIGWLDLRSPKTNRLGLLRRAIEQNWPKPEGGLSSQPQRTPAHVFASHYYAAYHGFAGEAATPPLAKDLEATGPFLGRLPVRYREESGLATCGRRFGRMVRDRHRNDPRARPNLSTNLVLYGDGFLEKLRNEQTSRATASLGRAQQAHQDAFHASYMQYLVRAEIAFQSANPELYGAFMKERATLRDTMAHGTLKVSETWLARFDKPESRLQAFAEHFSRHREHPVWDFWEWDRRLNPSPFRNPNEGEAHP